MLHWQRERGCWPNTNLVWNWLLVQYMLKLLTYPNVTSTPSLSRIMLEASTAQLQKLNRSIAMCSLCSLHFPPKTGHPKWKKPPYAAVLRDHQVRSRNQRKLNIQTFMNMNENQQNHCVLPIDSEVHRPLRSLPKAVWKRENRPTCMGKSTSLKLAKHP